MNAVVLIAYVLCIAIATVLLKIYSAGTDPYTASFTVAVGSLATIIPFMVLTNGTLMLPKSMWWGLGAGMLFSLSSILYVLSMNRMPLSIVTPVANTYVIPVLFLSVFFLGDNLTWQRMLGIAISLVGIGIIAWSS